jgi:pimeloyl-ACP methyl ester carboxylesterase
MCDSLRFTTRRKAAWQVAVAVLAWFAESTGAQSNGSSLTESQTLRPLAREPRSAPAERCHDLPAMSGPNLTIVSADATPRGAELCRVRGVVPPEVEFMLELPSAWNGRLYVLGNGGYGGEAVTGDYGIAERTRATDLGFATLFTNLGHDSLREPGGDWARGNLAKKLDYGLRGLHVATLAAKEILKHYYAAPLRHSYFDGCSTGGGQALKAAERFPQDYDGVVGGAPVLDFVELQLYGWNNQMAILKTPLSPAKVASLARRVMELFDAADGVRDGVIENPLAVDFEPERDLRGDPAFTSSEIRALMRIYRGVYVDGKQVAPGVPVGAEGVGQTYMTAGFESVALESGWATRLIPDAQGYLQQRANVETWLKNLAFPTDAQDRDITNFDPARDLPRLKTMAQILDANDPDLGAYRARGGKLILYHGWADTGVNPMTTVRYFERVRQLLGSGTDEFARLYMVPGMFHCRGGLNVDRFDAMSPVISWVERGTRPEALIASRVEEGRVMRTRPLCPYPQTARYRGTGSTDQAANFSCGKPGA